MRKLVARMRQAARRATDTSQGRVAAISRAHPSTAKMMVQFMAAMGSLVYPSESKWSVSDGDGTKLRAAANAREPNVSSTWVGAEDCVCLYEAETATRR